MDKKTKNLIKFIDLFKDRPATLAHLLIKHDCLSNHFQLRLEDKIQDKPKRFSDIKKLLDFYESLFNITKKEDWNQKLLNAIKSQNFEKAAEIRDYMIKKGIQIKI